MTDEKRQDLNSHAVPFFARYLEGQLEELSDEEAEAVGGGNSFANEFPCDFYEAVTLKFPSDNEDSDGGPIVTLKFPSDQEDGGGGGSIKTRKYPSDGDE